MSPKEDSWVWVWVWAIGVWLSLLVLVLATLCYVRQDTGLPDGAAPSVSNAPP